MPHQEDVYVQRYNKETSSIITFDEEQIEHAPEGTAGPLKALYMLLKSFIGTGVIFLPGSFVNGGLVVSVVLMVVIAIICTYSFHALVQSQRTVGGSYGNVANALYGRWMRYFIDFSLCLSQMGFVSSYFIFISSNIGVAVRALNDGYEPFDSKYYIWVILVIMIPFTWARKLNKLAPLVALAEILIAFGLICVVYFSSRQISEFGLGPGIVMANSNDFALMIGTAVFAFEGIGMVVPVVEAMKEPEKFPRVLNWGMIISTVVFTFIGLIGYLAYGQNTASNVVTNFPAEPLSVAVQILYAVAIISSAPFMLYPAVTITENGLYGANQSGRVSWRYKWMKNCTRSLIPLVCACVSFGVGASNLDKFVSLVGSVACMPLCFIYPGLFHYKTSPGKWTRPLDVVLVVFGCAILVYTLYINVNSWIH
ncbi:transmembrane amino acid transporter protein-domain-containing protein [Blakeslea trispora]|nr:transmembrane amino acid transporter protein-domain-containing protein [Blakeslea trispora]